MANIQEPDALREAERAAFVACAEWLVGRGRIYGPEIRAEAQRRYPADTVAQSVGKVPPSTWEDVETEEAASSADIFEVSRHEQGIEAEVVATDPMTDEAGAPAPDIAGELARIRQRLIDDATPLDWPEGVKPSDLWDVAGDPRCNCVVARGGPGSVNRYGPHHSYECPMHKLAGAPAAVRPAAWEAKYRELLKALLETVDDCTANGSPDNEPLLTRALNNLHAHVLGTPAVQPDALRRVFDAGARWGFQMWDFPLTGAKIEAEAAHRYPEWLQRMAEAEDAAGSISVGGLAADVGFPLQPPPVPCTCNPLAPNAESEAQCPAHGGELVWAPAPIVAAKCFHCDTELTCPLCVLPEPGDGPELALREAYDVIRELAPDWSGSSISTVLRAFLSGRAAVPSDALLALATEWEDADKQAGNASGVFTTCARELREVLAAAPWPAAPLQADALLTDIVQATGIYYDAAGKWWLPGEPTECNNLYDALVAFGNAAAVGAAAVPSDALRAEAEEYVVSRDHRPCEHNLWPCPYCQPSQLAVAAAPADGEREQLASWLEDRGSRYNSEIKQRHFRAADLPRGTPAVQPDAPSALRRVRAELVAQARANAPGENIDDLRFAIDLIDAELKQAVQPDAPLPDAVLVRERIARLLVDIIQGTEPDENPEGTLNVARGTAEQIMEWCGLLPDGAQPQQESP